MKRIIFTLIVACALAIQLNAQTPFDSFAPEATRPMLELEESTNTTSDSILCAIVADVQNQMLLLVDVSNGQIVLSAPIADDIRKWLSVDPLADNYPGVSPYAYCLWNPIKNIDPDGRWLWLKPTARRTNARICSSPPRRLAMFALRMLKPTARRINARICNSLPRRLAMLIY